MDRYSIYKLYILLFISSMVFMMGGIIVISAYYDISSDDGISVEKVPIEDSDGAISSETISSDTYEKISVSSNISSITPVKYSCCKNYIANQGMLLDDFENLDIWTLNGLNESYIIKDTINFKEGMRGLKLVAKNGDKVYITRKIHEDFSNTKNFAFDVYVDDATTLGYITFYFTSRKSWSKYFSYTIDSPFINGWNHFIIKKSDMYNNRGEDWNNTIIMFRLAAYPITGSDTNVTIDDFRYDASERAKVIFTFDDGTHGDFDNAEPILTANNQKAVSFVVIDWINNPDFLTSDQLKKLQGSGWDISSHTMSHPNLTELNDNDMIKELNNSYDWLINNGFQKTAGFIAYPYGYWNENVVTKTKQRYILARGVHRGIEEHLSPYHKGGIYKLKVIDIHSNTTVQSIKDIIDHTIDQEGLLILLFHRIVDNNPGEYQYLKSNFQQISDYIKSRSSDIDVITFSDYVNVNINKFTPVINKTVRIYSNGTVDLITNNKYDEYMPNIVIKPSKGYIDIDMRTYHETGDQLILFNEYTSYPSIDVQYLIGGRIPGQKYSVKIYWNNGTVFQDFYMIADNKGYINYYSTGSDVQRYTEIRQLVVTDKIPEYRDNVYKNDIATLTKSEELAKNDKIVEYKDNDNKKDKESYIHGFNNIESIIALIILIVYIKSKKK